MPDFEKVIVHVLDCEQNTCIMSTSCMQELQPEVEKMMQTKASKVFSSSAKKSGKFKESSQVKQWLDSYKLQEISFEQLSEQLARHIFDAKLRCAFYYPSDLLIAQVMEEGRRYLLAIDNAYSEGITHTLVQDEAGMRNEIIPYRTLLSSSLVKSDKAFLVELSDYALHCVESKVEVEAEKINFFAEIILESTTSPSYKEAVSSLAKITEEISDKYDLDQMEVVPKMKSIIKENIEQQTPIEIEEVAELLFAEKPLARDDFREELRKQGVEKPINVEYVKPARSDKVQKIKTDKGIEIIIPVDYMNSRDFVEFKNQPDGTISIQLKNITRITSK